jgi:hypothetical protein
MEMIMSKCGEGRALNLRVVGLGGLRHDDIADEEAVGAGATAKKHMGVECGSDGSLKAFHIFKASVENHLYYMIHEGEGGGE